MTQKRTLDLDKVLAKATEMIESRGLSETTMPNLAKALGVRSQSLYHYVKNRSQLLSLVAASRIRLLYQDLLKQLVGLSGHEALFKFADVVRDRLLEDQALATLLYHMDEFSDDSEVVKEVVKILDLGDQLQGTLNTWFPSMPWLALSWATSSWTVYRWPGKGGKSARSRGELSRNGLAAGFAQRPAVKCLA